MKTPLLPLAGILALMGVVMFLAEGIRWLQITAAAVVVADAILLSAVLSKGWPE